jgi:hypothetical protein
VFLRCCRLARRRRCHGGVATAWNRRRRGQSRTTASVLDRESRGARGGGVEDGRHRLDPRVLVVALVLVASWTAAVVCRLAWPPFSPLASPSQARPEDKVGPVLRAQSLRSSVEQTTLVEPRPQDRAEPASEARTGPRPPTQTQTTRARRRRCLFRVAICSAGSSQAGRRRSGRPASSSATGPVAEGWAQHGRPCSSSRQLPCRRAAIGEPRRRGRSWASQVGLHALSRRRGASNSSPESERPSSSAGKTKSGSDSPQISR